MRADENDPATEQTRWPSPAQLIASATFQQPFKDAQKITKKKKRCWKPSVPPPRRAGKGRNCRICVYFFLYGCWIRRFSWHFWRNLVWLIEKICASRYHRALLCTICSMNLIYLGLVYTMQFKFRAKGAENFELRHKSTQRIEKYAVPLG